MKNSQLIEVARALTKKEVRELRKWLASPAHNHRDDVIQLFEYLQQGNHLEDDKFLEKERIFKKIFPEEDFDDAKLRQTMHFTLKAIEDYLIYCEYSADQVSTQLSLARVYQTKELNHAAQKILRNVKRQQTKKAILDDEFYMKQYHLHYQENELEASGSAYLQEVSDFLEIGFIIKKLRMACLMINYQSIYKKEYKYGLLEPLLHYIESNNLLQVKAIAIYYYFYKSITNLEKEDYYFTYRDTIFNYSHILPHFEMRNNYLLAINYCINKANRGKQKFRKEVFSLYRQGIENGVLFTDEGKLSYSTFRNTVNMGTVVKEFDWIYSFIQKYQQHLPSEQKEETVEFALGKYHFEKGNYDKARDHLMYINPSSVNLNLMIKSMLIRIYYSQDEFQLLDALLESMKVYINRKKNLAQQYRRPFLNLIKYTKKLVRVNPYDKEAKAKLRQEIEAANPLISKDWFLEQVDNL